MGDYPIIFSAPMVRALLDGRKTMTRRLARGRPITRRPSSGTTNSRYDGMSPWTRVKRGDRLWVRENYYKTDDGDHEMAVYAADKDAAVHHINAIELMAGGYDLSDEWKAPHLKLRPSIHMPRWASRLTLVVTATKIERLQDISEDDAEAEGMREPSLRELGGDLAQAAWSQRQVFGRLWCHLHGLKSWQSNPEVVALTFTVHKVNIDQMTPRPTPDTAG